MFRLTLCRQIHHHPSLFSSSPILLATGTVKQWNAKGNFGFITDDDTQKPLFVSVKELVFADPFESKRFLIPLQRVRFDKAPRDNGSSGNTTTVASNSSTSKEPQQKHQEEESLPTRRMFKQTGKIKRLRRNSKSNEVDQQKIPRKEAQNLNNELVIDEMCLRVRDISGKPLISPALMDGASRSIHFHHHSQQISPSSSSVVDKLLSSSSSSFENHNQNQNQTFFIPTLTRSASYNKNNFSAMGRNFGGIVTQLQGKYGFISSNSTNDFISFCVRDVLHATCHMQQSEFVRVGDRVTFDVVPDPNRIGKTKCVNIRKDLFRSAAAAMF